MSSRGTIYKREHISPRPPTEFVRSHYQSTWTGAVLRRVEREYKGRRVSDLLTVVLLLDRRGRPMHRKIVKRIAADWTVPVAVAAAIVANVNPDWWKIP